MPHDMEKTGHDPDCIFCRIVAKTCPAQVVYADEQVMAFHDLHPKAPVHLLVIPTQHIESLWDITPAHSAWMTRLVCLLPELAAAHGLSGFKIQVNNGPDGGQEVPHLHVHLLGTPRQNTMNPPLNHETRNQKGGM